MVSVILNTCRYICDEVVWPECGFSAVWWGHTLVSNLPSLDEEPATQS